MALPVVHHSVPTDTRYPTGETNAYVIGRDPALLVDPAARTDTLDRAVAAHGVEHLLVTHTHPDHVGAVAAYAEETGATVWARDGFADRFEAATDVAPDRTFEVDATIPLGDERVQILDAPGHAPDHVAVRAGPDGPVCCGDCAVRDGSVVVGGPGADMRAYLDTLRRLRALSAPQLLPGHGPAIDDPESTLDRIIDHRLDRERRVREAVEAGSRTLDSILDRAYETDLTGVEDLARATVVAHLEKLDDDGELRWDGDRARPVE